MKQLVRLACALPLASACSAGSEQESELAVAQVAQPVVGGESIEACNWPSTVSVNAWGSCSGTLIHSRVVTTAAHCISDPDTTIFFGAGRNSPGSFSLPATCKVGAEGARGANTEADWAYCMLPEDPRVAMIPITPPLVGCEAEKYLKAGMQAWVVGFGTTSSLGYGAGVKRQVPVIINAIDKPNRGTLNVGDADQGACHGDSGGPLYVHVSDAAHDWGYRVLGSTSGAGESLCDCTCSTVYVNISNHVTQIEANEHIDVTPCTNGQGAFEMTPACAALQTGVQDGTGDFPACSGVRVPAPMNSCGAADPIGVAASASSGLGGTAGAFSGAGGSGALPVSPSLTPPSGLGVAAGSGALGTASMLGSTASPASANNRSSGSTLGTGAGLGSTSSSSEAGTATPSGGSSSVVSCQISQLGLTHSRGLEWLTACGVWALVHARRRRRASSRDDASRRSDCAQSRST